MKKTAIVILSDPRNNAEDALGRVFNALVLANDLKNREKDFKIFFQGVGTRWVEELEMSSHPAHALYTGVKSSIAGVSAACATVFKANAQNCGVPILSEFDIPGIGGATSLAKYLLEGYNIVTF